MKYKFISFEGNECSGKSTQIKLLDSYLTKIKKDHIILREPGGNKQCEKIRKIVLGGNASDWDAKEELLLMYAARANLVRTTIKPTLLKDHTVVTDRFLDSTRVYQGIAGGLGLDFIDHFHKLILGAFYPDITFILDIDYNTSIKRILSRGNSIDRFEKKNEDFFNLVSSGYQKIAKQDNRFIIINALMNKDEIFKIIKSKLEI